MPNIYLYPRIPTFTGPGDIQPGAYAWWGLQSYNASYGSGGNPAIDLNNDGTGAFAGTVNILSSGLLDVATATTLIAGGASRISKWYDQTGNGRHQLQSNNTIRAQLQLTAGPGGNTPAAFFDGQLRGDAYATAGAATIPQPLSYAGVAKIRNAAGVYVLMGDMTNVNIYFGVRQSGPDLMLAAGSGEFTGPVITQNVWHSVQGLSIPTNQQLAQFETTSSSGSGFGTAGYTAAMGLSNNANGSFWDGWIAQMGIWPVDNTSVLTAMNANQHANWGF